MMHFALAGACLLAASCGAQAEPATAIVEEVQSKAAGLEAMDYLSPGKVLSLAKGDRIVLGYLKSCWRETIVEGTIVIGAEQSTVTDGKVERVKVLCDSRVYTLGAAQSKTSAAMAFRKPPPKDHQAPEVTLYGLSPVIECRIAGRLVIERLEPKGERIELDIGPADLQRGTFFDLAAVNKSLAAGGIYRASLGPLRPIVFRIDPQAKAGSGPVLGRLLRLLPAT